MRAIAAEDGVCRDRFEAAWGVALPRAPGLNLMAMMDAARDGRAPVHRAILSKNDRLAERNRGDFEARGLCVLNVLSSPGSGKTALLQRTLAPSSGGAPRKLEDRDESRGVDRRVAPRRHVLPRRP